MRREGRVRKSLQSNIKDKQHDIRNEIDAKSEDNIKAQRALRNERKALTLKPLAPLPSEHDLLLPDALATLPRNGLLQPRRHALPHRESS